MRDAGRPRPGAHRAGGGPSGTEARSGSGLAESDGRSARADRWIQAEPGGRFLAEVREQPAALGRLLGGREAVQRAARAIAERAPRIVRLVAHGTSDNAASFGVYAFGILAGVTALRDSISLSIYYGAELELDRSAVVAISQSGRTPDVVAYVERARSAGALTIGITNDVASPLAAAAELVIGLDAGPEQAVAATKTYTSTLAALGLLAAELGGRGDEYAGGVEAVAAAMPAATSSLEGAVSLAAGPFAFVGRMFVIGRGIEYATAREVALKLVETCRVAAEPLTATDLAHGPVAALDPLFPVWTIASDDASLPAVVDAARRVRETGATLVATGAAADAIEGAWLRLATPPPPTPLHAPLLSVLPGQLFAWALARARGLDPDAPTHLSKVTVAP